MKQLLIIIFSALLVSPGILAQRPSQNPWVKWQYLIGDWEGQGTGKPGEGTGGFSFQPDLDGKVLVRKNSADYPAANGRPASSHKDLMIIYPGSDHNSYSAVYFDNEGHVINYSINFNDSSNAIIFVSVPSNNAPAFRLSYIPVEKNKVNIKFEIAPAGKPGIFAPYIEAFATRKK